MTRLIPGLSPSISRAALMITFYEGAALVGRRSDGLCSLAASALLITLVDPDSPREIGFQLSFTCSNSRIPKEEDKHGGVGLQNVKQRLDLIYGNSYSLDISDQSDTYTVILKIPL